VANNPLYVKGIKTGQNVLETEELDLRTRYNEWAMTGLRRAKGIELAVAKREFDVDILAQFEEDIQPYINDGDLLLDNGNLRLSIKGFLLADRIASDLFLLES